MANTYIDSIKLIMDGQDVDAKTVNRRLTQLINNIQFIKDRLDEAGLSQAMFLRDVACEEDLSLGQAAYFNKATQQYERALAATITTEAMGVVSDSANVVGLCYSKATSTRCTLLIGGAAELSLTLAVADDVTDGEYYLSGATEGFLVQSASAIAVPVAQVCGSMVIVRTSFADVFARHQHLKYELLCLPSGLPVLDTGVWTITDEDVDSEGWLPADHAVFEDHAPVGAAFGYNLSVSELQNVWPPVPTDSTYLEWHRGDASGGIAVPQGPEGLVIIDRYGIWWMSNCESDVPWAGDYDDATTTTTTEPLECPRIDPMRLILYFTHLVFQTDTSAVLSLRSNSDPLTVTCVDTGEAATTGHLQLNLDLSLLVDDEVTEGSTALKGLSAEGKLLQGPVIEGIKSANSKLLVSGTETLSDGFTGGRVTLTSIINPLDAELPIQNIQLEQVREEFPKGNMALMFPVELDSSFFGEIHIPAGLGVDEVTVGLRFWVLGDTAGTLPELTLNARVIPTPTVATDLPDSGDDISVAVDTAAAVGVYQYVAVTSEEFTAAPGDTVQFEMIREAATNDGYAGNVYILKMLGVILGAT